MVEHASSRLSTGRPTVRSTISARISALRERSEPFRPEGRSTATWNVTARTLTRPARCTDRGLRIPETPTDRRCRRPRAGAVAWMSGMDRPTRGTA